MPPVAGTVSCDSAPPTRRQRRRHAPTPSTAASPRPA